jgi:hypothetical protein
VDSAFWWAAILSQQYQNSDHRGEYDTDPKIPREGELGIASQVSQQPAECDIQDDETQHYEHRFVLVGSNGEG